MVKSNDGLGGLCLVGGDDPVIEFEVLGLKQIWLLSIACDDAAHRMISAQGFEGRLQR